MKNRKPQHSTRTTFPVQKTACATCIYKPESGFNIAELEMQVADRNCPGHFKAHRVCHHSDVACCRGFWNRHKDSFTVGQLAQRLQLVEYVTHDTLKS